MRTGSAWSGTDVGRWAHDRTCLPPPLHCQLQARRSRLSLIRLWLLCLAQEQSVIRPWETLNGEMSLLTNQPFPSSRNSCSKSRPPDTSPLGGTWTHYLPITQSPTCPNSDPEEQEHSPVRPHGSQVREMETSWEIWSRACVTSTFPTSQFRLLSSFVPESLEVAEYMVHTESRDGTARGQDGLWTSPLFTSVLLVRPLENHTYSLLPRGLGCERYLISLKASLQQVNCK